jgi:hypothetical protein
LRNETEMRGEQAIAIRYLTDHFERDWREISELSKLKAAKDSKEIFSGFMVRAKVPDPGGSVKLRGDSNTFGVSGVYGEVELTRIDNVVS